MNYFQGDFFIYPTRKKLVNPFLAWGWGYVSTKIREWEDSRTEDSIPLNFFGGIELPITNWLSLEGRAGHIWYFWQGEGHFGFQLALTLGPNY